MNSSRNGFTIIEMLVVLAIIVVLAGIAYAVTGSTRENGRQTVCLSNMRQLDMAFTMYCQEADVWDKPAEIEKIPEHLRAGNAWITFLKPYGWEQGKLFCPDFQRNGPLPDGYLRQYNGKNPDAPYLLSFSEEYARCGSTVPLVLDDNHNPHDPNQLEAPKILFLVARYDGSVARVQHRPTIGPDDADPCFTGGTGQ